MSLNPQCSGSLLYLAIIICCVLLLLSHLGGWLAEWFKLPWRIARCEV